MRRTTIFNTSEHHRTSFIRTEYVGGLGDGECYFPDGNMTDRYSAELAGKELAVTVGYKVSTLRVTGTSLHKHIGLFLGILFLLSVDKYCAIVWAKQ